MISVNEKITALRRQMKQNGVQACIVPSSDPHMSEYLPAHWESRSYFSGFNGSAGTLVVTEKESGLWTDGRYFIQAAHQLEGSEIVLYRMAVKGVPTYIEFLADKLKDGETVGFDGKMLSASSVAEMREKFADKKLNIKAVDLIENIWPERPEIPATKVFVHDVKYAGFTCHEKLGQVREELKKQHAHGEVFTKLDCVAWLMNIRADDIAYNPLAVSYAIVYSDSAFLFINTRRVLPEALSYLKENGVTVREYEEIDAALEGINTAMTILVDPSSINYDLYTLLKNNSHVTVKEGNDTVVGLKGVKNETEIKNIIEAHVKDGRALVEFRVKFEEMMRNGETVTECTVCDMLRKYRAKQPNNMGESFGTIAAYNANAAMMHYSPKPDTCSTLKNQGFLLIDSGGQYLEGTTDITRTFVLGPLSREEKEHYTYVLKAHIALASAVFLEGCTGGNIDILSREQVWKHGIDYRCGTGHGVGMFSGVHEGPQNLRINNNVVFKKGMTITNEPGIYEEGKHGIRTENIMLVTDYINNEYGQFYRFEPITYFPIDTAGILTELMTDDELEWLNSYHRTVYEKLSPGLSGKELAWLKEHTEPIGRE
ncbi:aminopeptidase P family protein [Caproiciproducens sp.]|uniref:aminopeptidase P family protein n=1 Tax=Caproiciproducens sp. TaxID=1954376 RepID=UPI00289672A4|nr:aminopeptidase P family protein [Caproiciproducens sp.]